MDVIEDSYFSGRIRNRGAAHLLVSPNASEHFGEHVMIDGYECLEERLNDREIVLSCLNELPKRLLMKPLSNPEVYFAKGNSPKDPGGWTGLVVVEEAISASTLFQNFNS
jgi:S-adenosylmethionine/arginine decarboxylase-like enzyme